jgi:hypothetical protein
MDTKPPATGDRPPAEPRLIVPQVPGPADLPRSAVTPDGRLTTPAEEERRNLQKAAAELLAELESIDVSADAQEDSEEVWDEVMRRIDEGRPHRPLFGGAGP